MHLSKKSILDDTYKLKFEREPKKEKVRIVHYPTITGVVKTEGVSESPFPLSPPENTDREGNNILPYSIPEPISHETRKSTATARITTTPGQAVQYTQRKSQPGNNNSIEPKQQKDQSLPPQTDISISKSGNLLKKDIQPESPIEPPLKDLSLKESPKWEIADFLQNNNSITIVKSTPLIGISKTGEPVPTGGKIIQPQEFKTAEPKLASGSGSERYIQERVMAEILRLENLVDAEIKQLEANLEDTVMLNTEKELKERLNNRFTIRTRIFRPGTKFIFCCNLITH